MTQKTAVILFNLGGPDKPESIRPFLINFFMDKNIIRAPWPVRFFLSRWIAKRRSENEAGNAYAKLGGKSPLLENTQQQAGALQGELGPDYRVFVAMRYWHPRAEKVMDLVKDYAPDKIVLLPLYPQYSTTTTKSSIEEWQKTARKKSLSVPTEIICCYPFEDGFIKASAEKILEQYRELETKSGKKPRILFSAHGLPERIVKSGDPYQWQCEESARKIAEALGTMGLFELDWAICYQSRVGPMRWIGPSIEAALEDAAKDKVPVLVYPHAFVSEHVETLVEIEDGYRSLSEKLGIPAFARVETVGIHPAFIRGLTNLVKNAATKKERLCPSGFSECCQSRIKSGFKRGLPL